MRFNDVATARLSTGDYAILIGIRDPETRVPWVELATPTGGVYLREQYATYGTAANDNVEIRRYRPEDIQRTRADLSLTTPYSVSRAPLRPGAAPSAAGLYELSLPGGNSAEWTATLNLRPGGVATLITKQEGKAVPVAKQGIWTQTGSEVRVDLGGRLMVWTLGINGLTPRTWDRKEWGPVGLPLRRSFALR
jgi:hypothetical protein